MKDLFKLLERFSRSLNQDRAIKEAIARVIGERVGVAFDIERLALKDGVLTLNAGATLKNEIRLKEEAIKDELRETHHILVTRVIYK